MLALGIVSGYRRFCPGRRAPHSLQVQQHNLVYGGMPSQGGQIQISALIQVPSTPSCSPLHFLGRTCAAATCALSADIFTRPLISTYSDNWVGSESCLDQALRFPGTCRSTNFQDLSWSKNVCEKKSSTDGFDVSSSYQLGCSFIWLQKGQQVAHVSTKMHMEF